MHARKQNVDATRQIRKKFVRYPEGAALYSMGVNTFQRLAREGKATYRVGKAVWVNLDKFEKYFETFSED